MRMPLPAILCCPVKPSKGLTNIPQVDNKEKTMFPVFIFLKGTYLEFVKFVVYCKKI